MIAACKFVDSLKQLKSIGVDQIELCGHSGGGAILSSRASPTERPPGRSSRTTAWKAVSCHFLFPELRDNLAKAIAWSKELGLEQMMIPTVKSGATTGTLEEAKLLTDQFNKLAVDINKAGMRTGSHNEAFDLVKLPDGTFIYDHIIAMTDPKLIGFQFQMSTYNSGMIAAEYFAGYPTRFFSMHVQDLDIKAGRTPVVNGRGGGYPQTSVGKGEPRLGRDVRGGKESGRHQELLRRAGDADDDRECRGSQGDESVAGWIQGSSQSGVIGTARYPPRCLTRRFLFRDSTLIFRYLPSSFFSGT